MHLVIVAQPYWKLYLGYETISSEEDRNVCRHQESMQVVLQPHQTETEGGFRRRALLALYSTRINYLTLKISKCHLVPLWLD